LEKLPELLLAKLKVSESALQLGCTPREPVSEAAPAQAVLALRNRTQAHGSEACGSTGAGGNGLLAAGPCPPSSDRRIPEGILRLRQLRCLQLAHRVADFSAALCAANDLVSDRTARIADLRVQERYRVLVQGLASLGHTYLRPHRIPRSPSLGGFAHHCVVYSGPATASAYAPGSRYRWATAWTRVGETSSIRPSYRCR